MFPPAEDDFRWTDADYQRQIDRLVRATLYDWELMDKSYTVETDTVEKRIEELRRWLRI